jgi:integrase
MSTYKKPDRPHYFYDFTIRGRRFQGSTECSSKREADAFEKRRRREAESELRAEKAAGHQYMTFGRAATLYWEQVGQYASSSVDIEWSLAWLQDAIGLDRRLTDINDELVARLVSRRRVDKGKTRRPVKPSTVNRTVTEPLRRILHRAAKVWHEPVGSVDWKTHLLKEPQERVRELRSEEETALFENLRSDFHPIVRFAILTGCRLSECVNLRWKDLDWAARQIWILGKGEKLAPIPMPPVVRELLWDLKGSHDEAVFTYTADRTRDGRVRGRRYPITYEGLKTQFRRDVKADVADFRFHDLRHTAATRLVRTSGSIRLAKEMLRHADIATTMKYAHVTHDDLLQAMERAGRPAGPLGEVSSKDGEAAES